MPCSFFFVVESHVGLLGGRKSRWAACSHSKRSHFSHQKQGIEPLCGISDNQKEPSIQRMGNEVDFFLQVGGSGFRLPKEGGEQQG